MNHREIKFRAWDKELKKWHTPIEWGNEASDLVIGYGNDSLPPSVEIKSDERFAWMQFTGLKDKNGKEIYEGDLLRHASNGFEPRNCWEVHYLDGCFVAKDGSGSIDYVKDFREYAVIGNIYENKELLKS